jgi:hypothetical protein
VKLNGAVNIMLLLCDGSKVLSGDWKPVRLISRAHGFVNRVLYLGPSGKLYKWNAKEKGKMVPWLIITVFLILN